MLRDYQARAVSDLRDGDLLVSPTGTGKSVMLGEIATREAAEGGLVLAVAHTRELIGQLSSTFRAAFLTPELNVLVRTVQELRNQPPIEGVTMLLWDEAHHCMGDDWARLRTEQYPRAKLIGATATPQRGDGRGLGAFFKRIIETISVREATARGFLVPATVLRPERFLGPGELAQDPVDAYLAHARGKKAIAFFSSVEQAIEATCRFRDHVPSACVWGEMPADERRAKVAAFARGELLVLTSVDVLTEGFDVPDVEVCILARGFGTRARYVQAVGRVLRPAVGKDSALVLDLRGVSHEHGEPDEPCTYHLDGLGIRRPSDGPDVRFCPVCGAATKRSACEACGYSGELRRRKPRILGLALDRFARVRLDDDDARAKRLSRWLKECWAKGWKDGRALHRYKAAYGDWAPSSLVKRAREMARAQ